MQRATGKQSDDDRTRERNGHARRQQLQRHLKEEEARQPREERAAASMGIPGLLPLLKDVTHHVHIGEYRGKVAGIDAFCWLHRGAFTCCTELVLGRQTDKCVGRRGGSMIG